MKSSERIKCASVVKEAQSLRKLWLIKIWESLPSILFDNISFTLLCCFTFINWASTYKYLSEIWINYTSKSCSWDKHVLLRDHFVLIRSFVKNHLKYWVERLFAWKVFRTTNYKNSVIWKIYNLAQEKLRTISKFEYLFYLKFKAWSQQVELHSPYLWLFLFVKFPVLALRNCNRLKYHWCSSYWDSRIFSRSLDSNFLNDRRLGLLLNYLLLLLL